jgi:ankyrin repeat protein
MAITDRIWMGCSVVLLLAVTGVAADLSLVDAVAKKDMEAARSLLRQNPDVNAAQPDGATALHWAAHWDDLDIADQLIRAGANVNAANDYGATPLSLACTNGNAPIVERLLAAGANPNTALPSGETPLMQCARTGSPDAVRFLLRRGADVNARDAEKGQTALMWAVAQKHAQAAQALLEGGADVNARSKGGFTPLLFAARVGDVESARVLLAAGANANDATPDGMPALVLASASGQEDVGIFLLDHGANPNATDSNGATALHYAVVKGITSLNGVRYANYVAHWFRPSLTALVRALVAHGANPNARLTKAPRIGGSANEATVGATPFMLAAASPDPNVMRILHEGGADARLATEKKMTPLIAAAGVARGQDFTEDEKREAFEALKLAVDLGADVNAANEDGLTALHGAAANGADAIVPLLADRGTKLDVKDKYQQTPLSIASGLRLPWIPYGEELGEIIQPSTAALLLKLGATPLDTPGYFTPVAEETEAYRINRSQRYQDPALTPAPAPGQPQKTQ